MLVCPAARPILLCAAAFEITSFVQKTLVGRIVEMGLLPSCLISLLCVLFHNFFAFVLHSMTVHVNMKPVRSQIADLSMYRKWSQAGHRHPRPLSSRSIPLCHHLHRPCHGRARSQLPTCVLLRSSKEVERHHSATLAICVSIIFHCISFSRGEARLRCRLPCSDMLTHHPSFQL
jgi:hypothetical protein